MVAAGWRPNLFVKGVMGIVRIYGRHLTAKNIRMSNFADAQLASYCVPSCSFDETPPEPPVLGDPSGPHIELRPTFDVDVEVPEGIVDHHIATSPTGYNYRRVMTPDGKSLDALGVMLCVWNGIEGYRIVRQRQASEA
jgi:hypothetical protein